MINKKIYLSDQKKNICYRLSLSREELESLGIKLPKLFTEWKTDKLNIKTLNKTDSKKLLKNQDTWAKKIWINECLRL